MLLDENVLIGRPNGRTRINVRPNFGFGTERVDFNTFGILLVSAESSRDTFVT